jgi:hypothetical protein
MIHPLGRVIRLALWEFGSNAVRLNSNYWQMVGEVGPATSNHFNAVVCPASVKATFARKRQFPELSSL